MNLFKKTKHLKPLNVPVAEDAFFPEKLISVGLNLEFLGPLLPQITACGIADGLLDPITHVRLRIILIIIFTHVAYQSRIFFS